MRMMPLFCYRHAQSNWATQCILFLFALLLLLFGWACTPQKAATKITSADIFHSDEMAKFTRAIEQHKSFPKATIAVFDIDDTMITAIGNLGTPRWFYTTVKSLRERGLSRLEAYNIMDVVDIALQPHIVVRPVEKSLPETIKAWQQQGVIVVALTSRIGLLKDITVKQLKSAGITLSNPLFSCIGDDFGNDFGVFSDGIMYVGEHPSKRALFNHFLVKAQRCGFTPELIGHTDDQPKYVHEIRSLAEEKGKWFIGQVYERALNERQIDVAKGNLELRELMQATNQAIVPVQFQHYFN